MTREGAPPARAGVGEPATDADLMRLALALAERAAETADVPIGALMLSPEGVTVGEGWNAREATSDPTAHAEIIALRAAARSLGTWNLTGCTLVVTVEPCTMCAGAVVAARVAKVVFGCWEPKTGAAGSLWDVLRDRRLPHRVEVRGGVMQAECAALVQRFFVERRAPEDPHPRGSRSAFRALAAQGDPDQHRRGDHQGDGDD
jgi:tRNA(adenine34) deaminase